MNFYNFKPVTSRKGSQILGEKLMTYSESGQLYITSDLAKKYFRPLGEQLKSSIAVNVAISFDEEHQAFRVQPQRERTRHTARAYIIASRENSGLTMNAPADVLHSGMLPGLYSLADEEQLIFVLNKEA